MSTGERHWVDGLTFEQVLTQTVKRFGDHEPLVSLQLSYRRTETASRKTRGGSGEQASMGPRSLERGNVAQFARWEKRAAVRAHPRGRTETGCGESVSPVRSASHR